MTYMVIGFAGTALGIASYSMHGWDGPKWCCIGLVIGMGCVWLLT